VTSIFLQVLQDTKTALPRSNLKKYFKIEKRKSENVSLNSIRKDGEIIYVIGNFALLSEDSKEEL
jgi:hypothetical protein